MAMIKEDNRVVFSSVVYEDEIVPLREYLQECSPTCVRFDFVGCDDIHLGVLQVVLAYQKLYDTEYLFGPEIKVFQQVCEGFETSNAHCA